MGVIDQLRRLWRPNRNGFASASANAELLSQSQAFCRAATLAGQTQTLIALFAGIWRQRSESKFQNRLLSWITTMEQDAELRTRFQRSCQSMLVELNSVSLFAEAGIPAQHAIFREVTARLFQHWLPPPRPETDTARLFAAVFRSARSVDRFLAMDTTLFQRLAAIFWSEEGPDQICKIHQDLNEALRLLAARVAARGTSRAIRQRSDSQAVKESPSYALIFATERLIAGERSVPARNCLDTWLDSVFACRGEVALVRIHMEDAGANSPLVFDLGAMDRALDRMEVLAATLADKRDAKSASVRRLLDTLVRGLVEDARVSALIRQSFNLLARKTVERTGHGGEHYIAHDRKEYWRMWAAAIGGGFLTVFTAAIKLNIVRHHRTPFMEFLLVGTNYAVSFLLLQIFGLALATKQPAMTGASLANIINRNRGEAQRNEITEFSASITRTQLAAALGNVLAVSLGAVLFNLVWLRIYHQPYVPSGQARKVYLSLRPLASLTAVDAALTGVLLWMAGIIGGWCENFAVYHHIPASIAEHPLRETLGKQRMQKVADWVDRNIGPWSTSISLGYLLAFTPVAAEFFGLPLDVRHVTLNTGMFALAAAPFGLAAFSQLWLYTAMVGIAVMFVLNLGVSFAIASFVALRAYDVRHRERVVLLRYVFKKLVSSPAQFFFPVRGKQAPEASNSADAAAD